MSDVARLGATLKAAQAAAAISTTGILAPAADEVSEAITAVLEAQAQEFEAISAKAAIFDEQFENLLHGAARQYINAEVANVRHILASVGNVPAQTMLGYPFAGISHGTPNAAADPPKGISFVAEPRLPIGPFEIFSNIRINYSKPYSLQGTGIHNAGISLLTPSGSTCAVHAVPGPLLGAHA